MHPVGPLPSRVYWLRRAIVIALAVVVLVALVWFALSKVTGGTTPPPGNSAAIDSGAPTTSAPKLTGVLATNSEVPDSGQPDSAIGESLPASAELTDSAGAPFSASDSASATASDTATAAAPIRTTTPAAKSTDAAAAKKAADKVAAEKAAAEKAAAQKKAAADKAAADKAAADKAAADKAAADKAAAEKAAADKAAAKKAAAAKAEAQKKAAAEKAAAEKAAAEAAKPKFDAQGRPFCADSAITVTSTVGVASYPSGSKPILGLTVRNSSDAACVRDLSGTLQVFTVFAENGTRIWSTSDCFPGEGTDVRFLQPGETLQYNIKWSGTSSAPGCAGERAVVGPGRYRVVAKLGDLEAKPAELTIT